MAQTVFVTGATGFIGRHVVWKLRERGAEVRCLVSPHSKVDLLHTIGAKIVVGETNNRDAMRAGMKGCESVYHMASWNKIGLQPHQVPLMREINVTRTRNVLAMAYHLGIPKIIYTSNLAAFGDTEGVLADESYRSQKKFATTYSRTKWEAYYEVALPLIAEGAPIVILMPGAVYGPDIPSIIGRVLEMYVKGRLPLLIGGEATYTWVYIDDTAEGHILAADKGKLGETYILGGPTMSIKEVFQTFAGLTRIPAPKFISGPRTRHVTALTVARLGKFLPLPAFIELEAIKSMNAGTYMAKSDKAHRELGWTPRPLEEGFQTMLDWYRDQS